MTDSRHRQRAAEFTYGCIANLTASRVSPSRVRGSALPARRVYLDRLPRARGRDGFRRAASRIAANETVQIRGRRSSAIDYETGRRTLRAAQGLRIGRYAPRKPPAMSGHEGCPALRPPRCASSRPSPASAIPDFRRRPQRRTRTPAVKEQLLRALDHALAAVAAMTFAPIAAAALALRPAWRVGCASGSARARQQPAVPVARRERRRDSAASRLVDRLQPAAAPSSSRRSRSQGAR